MLSVIVLAHNEEDNLKRCLDSLQGFDEILVIDDESTDNTGEIAQNLGARVIKRASGQDFASQRNAAMKEAKNDWILFVDADEEVSPNLQTELKQFELASSSTPHPDVAAYRIKRIDVWWGKRLMHGEVYSAAHSGIVRLVNRTRGRWVGRVHEQFETVGTVNQLEHELLHYPHPTVSDFLNSVNEYSSLRAKELSEQGKQVNIFELIIFPFFKFLYTYIIRAGYVEGAAGFSYSFIMSFHSFLVRSKLYVEQYKAEHRRI